MAQFFWATPEGFWVVYGCIGDDVLVTTVTYQLYGTSTPCSRLRIVPPESYMPWVPCQTCNFVETACERVGTLSVNCTVPVQETTWGRVKALYR